MTRKELQAELQKVKDAKFIHECKDHWGPTGSDDWRYWNQLKAREKELHLQLEALKQEEAA